jgi:purine-binding chemotaxis protein CheW
MDILKARKKAREAKGRDARRDAAPGDAAPEAAAPAPAPAAAFGAPPPPASAPHSSGPAEAASREQHPAFSNVLGAPPSAPAPPARRDPLADFLATYDEGELAHVLEAAQENHDEERRFLSFDLEGEAYAADIMEVREILKVVSFTEVPRAPREVLGVLSKRGIVMPVVDLALTLGLRKVAPPLDKDQRVLVAGEGERVCGLRVDRVRQVVRLGQRSIEEVPASLGNKNAHMSLGLGRARIEGQELPQMLILLDVPAVLAHFSETMGISAEREEDRR